TAVDEVAVPAVPAFARTHALGATADPASVVVARLTRRDTDDFGLVALTWTQGSAGPGTEARVRVREAGSWSSWQELHYEPSESPGGAEAAATGVRDGTEPLWVGDGDGVQVRVLAEPGAAPADVTLVLIDSAAQPSDAALAQRPGAAYLRNDVAGLQPTRPMAASGTKSITTSPGTSTAARTNGYTYVPKPDLVRRKQWGADPALAGPCDSPRYGETVLAAFVHHTAGSNNYSEGDAPAIVRSVYAYHTQGRGWCDIGYNFLVDRYGNVYEGRRGGFRRPVRGAHSGDYNTNSVGISLMGNFELVQPNKRIRGALVRVLAWKLQSNYRAPRARTWLNGARFRNISGHRDAMSTACPGINVYSRLRDIRVRVANVMGGFDTRIHRSWVEKYGGRTGVLGAPFIGERRIDDGRGRVTVFEHGRIYSGRGTGAVMVNGRMLASYVSDYDGVDGRLGYPTIDSQPSSRSGVRTTRFEAGRMFSAKAIGARALWGPILHRYQRAGGVNSAMGLPLSKPKRVPGGRRALFQYAWIYYDRSSDSTSVRYR
ncbi:MAG: N-acetylmuramoyl-L-alanine amidase, partial [Actinomycetota bacterium]|nr:N-acetylmuramoyl-L-alanine amidase [Actinomycetota bacterium]